MSQYVDFAAIYDKLINKDIDYNAWADKIIDICNKLNIAKEDYLDLACGTGNMTMKLAKYFKRTYAVDISSEMLTKAEKKIRSLSYNIKPKFVCQDISNLKLNHKFDLVTCCLDSTNYIIEESELKNYFEGVSNHLKENGLFLFDVNSYYKLTEILGNNIFTYDDEDVVYIWDNFLEDDILQMNLTFFVKENGFYRRFDEEHLERAYKEIAIEKLLNECGLKVINKLNNYEDYPIDDKCERIVYVLRKF